MKSKLEFALGIAKKAGAVRSGTETVRGEVRSGRASMVLIACDASENTKKRLIGCCEYYKIPCVKIALSTSALGDAVGKSGLVSAVSIAHHGVSRLVSDALTDASAEEA
ncbi:MAG: ribosomal L7Ae/L30e/S12e/Gadd45 family protein [Clostridia bacterium]|nr:ribosomal L7Ae/L30e/S12e/Gadd45 family protein [Clostridia bacterium]